MMLNERKIRILEAIISDYIRTAEPIASRTIAKKYDLGISSATIRNEMSDLEEMGLIVQPHASAGRVPSDKGYRLYVDELMHHREPSEEQVHFLQDLVAKNISQMDFLMQETAKALATLTNYTTIVSEPKNVKTTIKQIQFIPLDDHTIIMVLVSNSKHAKNYEIEIKQSVEIETLYHLSVIFNALFKNWCVEEILDNSESFTPEIARKVGVSEEFLSPIWKTFSSIIKEENVQVYTSGAKNFLDYPEFSNLDKARAIFDALEEQEVLVTLLGNSNSQDVSVVIGSENQLEELRNCSIIKANYSVGNQVRGSIGIIGPTRMDYPQVVSILNTIVSQISGVLKGIDGY